MSAENDVRSDRPLYDTTVGNDGLRHNEPPTGGPSAKRQKLDHAAALKEQQQLHQLQQQARILVLRDIGGGQQVLVEASSADMLQTASESAGLHTLAETAALEVPATSLPEDALSLIQQEPAQEVYLTHAPNVLVPSHASQPRFVIKPAEGYGSQTYQTLQTMEPATVVVAPTAHQGAMESVEDDTHRCGKCGNEFTTLEDYIKHKLYGDKCRMKSRTVVSAGGILGNEGMDAEFDLGALFAMRNGRGPGRPRLRGCSRGRGRGRGRGRSQPQSENSDQDEPQRKVRAKYKRISSIHTLDNIYVHDKYKCPNCDKIFRRQAALNRHVEYDHIKREDSGDDTGDAATMEELDIERDENYVVEIAEEEGDEEEDAKGEREKVVVGEDGAALTVVQGKAANVKTNDYMRRPYGCSLCKARFLEITVLRAHMLTHSDKREYKCHFENCPFAFKTKGSLKRHIRRHTDERPFKCEECQRTFRESGALTRHLRSRTPCSHKADSDLPRYGKCADLVMPLTMLRNVHDEKGPAQHVTLKTSKFMLAGQPILSMSTQAESEKGQEEPVKYNQCRVCLITIDDKEKLREHLKSHLVATPFRCGLCTYATCKKSELVLHKNIVHHIQPQVTGELVRLPPIEEKCEELVVVSDLPVRSEQVVVEQVLEQYINQGHDLRDFSGETTHTAIIDGQEVEVHIIRANSQYQQEDNPEFVDVTEQVVGEPGQLLELETTEIVSGEHDGGDVSQVQDVANGGLVTVTTEHLVEAEPHVIEPMKIVSEEIPVTEDIPITEETTLTEVIPITEETALSEEIPVTEETALSEEMPVTEETALSEEMPVTEETALSEEIPVTEETALSEEMPVTEETALSEEIPVTEEITVSAQIPCTEQLQVTEEILATTEIQITDGTPDSPDELLVTQQVLVTGGAGVISEGTVEQQEHVSQELPGTNPAPVRESISMTVEMPVAGELEMGVMNMEGDQGDDVGDVDGEETVTYMVAHDDMISTSAVLDPVTGELKLTASRPIEQEDCEELTTGQGESEELTAQVHEEEPGLITQSEQNAFIQMASDSMVTEPVTSRVAIDKQTREAAVALQQLLELREISSSDDVLPIGVHGYKMLHTCPVCGRGFRGSSYLRLHMRSHTGERPYPCTQCGKTFATKDTLTKHTVAHRSDRRYKCGECGKMFKRISHVHEHLRIHSNDRPYPCNYCDKSFKAPNACKVHLRTHTDELPWECPTCHRLFREKGSLDRHLRIHTGAKPYRCTHCGRCFSEHGTLSRHIKAKFPCTRQLMTLREQHHSGIIPEADINMEVTQEMDGEENQGDEMRDVEAQSDEVTTQMESRDGEAVEEAPSMLAEFSSVVADTQQYIIQNDVGDIAHVSDVTSSAQQGATQYVMVTADGTEQAIEIVMDGGDTDDTASLQNTQFMLLDDGNITLRMVNEGDADDQMVTVVDALSQEVLTAEVQEEEEGDNEGLEQQEHITVTQTPEDKNMQGQNKAIMETPESDVVNKAMIESLMVEGDHVVEGDVMEEQVIQ